MSIGAWLSSSAKSGKWTPSSPAAIGVWPSLTPSFSDTQSLLLTAASHQHVDFGNNIRPAYNQPFSMELWWFPTDTLVNRSLLTNDLTGVDCYWLATSSGFVTFDWLGSSGSGRLHITTNYSFTVDKWYQIVLTYDGSNSTSGFHVYINGVSQTVGSDTNTPITALNYNAATWLGNDPGDFTPQSGYFNRLSYWNIELNSDQVTSLYGNGKLAEIKNSTGLVNYYLPGNGKDTTTTVYDLQGTADGTIGNSAPYKQFAPYRFALANTIQIKNYPSVNAPIVGNKMYVAYYQSGNANPGFDAPDMEIFSLATPLSPTVVGTLPTTSGTYGTFTPQPPAAVEGGYAYINYYKGTTKQLNVVDVSDPSNPAVVATVDSGVSNPNLVGAFKNGNYIYQPSTGTTLLITDVSNPLSPALTVGSISAGSGWCYAVFIPGTPYMYLNRGASVVIYDLTNPTSPTSVGSFTAAGTPNFMKINGNYLYMLEYGVAKMEIVDISNPLSPTIVKTVTTPSQPYGLDFANNLVYVSCQSGECVAIYSISDPPNAFQAGLFTLPVFATTGDTHQGMGIMVSGNVAYVLSTVQTADAATTGDLYGFLDIFQL